MLDFLVAELGVCGAVPRTQGYALRRGAGGSICDCEHCDDRADDNGGCARAAGADKWVAVPVVGLHRDGGHGEVCAVDSDHGGLSEARLRIVFLHCGVDGDGGDDEEREKIDCYGTLVHAAA